MRLSSSSRRRAPRPVLPALRSPPAAFLELEAGTSTQYITSLNLRVAPDHALAKTPEAIPTQAGGYRSIAAT